MKKIVPGLFAATILFLCLSDIRVEAETESALAKCAIPSFDKEYENSRTVFVGKVVKIEKDGNKRIFKFEVKKYWKGVEKKYIKVSVRERPRYQAQFMMDGEYLVFAKDDNDGGFRDGATFCFCHLSPTHVVG